MESASTIEVHKRQNERIWKHMPPCMQACFSDPSIIEIMVNPDGKLLVDDLQSGIRQIGTMDRFNAESLIKVVASVMGASITEASPIFEGEFNDGSRFSAAIPPVVSAPMISIRRRALQIFSLDDYVAQGVMTIQQRAIVAQWVLERKNILVVGGTSSGKTTLINAVIAEIAQVSPQHRLIVLEDTVELQCQAENVIQMKSSREVPLQALVKTTLRHRPDRILVGEVRGPEAFDLLTAWSTGHPGGVASLHANSAQGAFLRLEQLLEVATQSPMRSLIAEAVDAIVYIEKTATGRQVKELLTVDGYHNHQYQTQRIETE